MKETKILEFKREISNSFLKTVSAFSNYSGGTIVFGINDDGEIVGIENIKDSCLDIENKINDSISPNPNYTVDVNEKDRTITVKVEPGETKPYLYKGKAYKRNDTATIEVGYLELSRLILAGRRINFEELPSENQELEFNVLKEKLSEEIGIKDFSKDILKTLNLYSDNSGFNNAAAILADKNSFPGIDIVVFGETINIIKKRERIENKSILKAFSKALKIFRDTYQYEEIEGFERKRKSLIPEAAFREAVANAIIHRTWDSQPLISIAMYDDRIEIVSPGGLPAELTEDEYINGKISVLRNPILSNVFYRLRIVELFGTGILRIKQDYAKSFYKPSFEFTEHTITITLPVSEKDLNISQDEHTVYKNISPTTPLQISDICSQVPYCKSKVLSILNTLVEKHLIQKTGNGRGTKYRR